MQGKGEFTISKFFQAKLRKERGLWLSLHFLFANSHLGFHAFETTRKRLFSLYLFIALCLLERSGKFECQKTD
jgi:hypothetical protein